jgi:predicted O-methyltransferase YrrM
MSAPSLKLLSEKRDDAYVPSYAFGGDDLGERQRGSVAAVEKIPGWLRPEDILKLYELAYFAPGPVLEIGCYHGKSTVVIARALADRGTRVPFFSVDVDPAALRATSQAAAEHGVGDRIVLVRGSSRACFRAMPTLHPALVFIDGDHSREGVRRDLDVLRTAVPDGAVLLFHDYADPRNADPAAPELGVVDAVDESWVARDCDFGGVFGCCGVFARRRGGPPLEVEGPPMLELVPLDSWRLRYVQWLRLPLGRRLRTVKRRFGSLRPPAGGRRHVARG